MLTVPIEDIIECKSWMHICEHHYETGDEMPSSGLVYVNIEHIKDFFNKCKDYPDRKFVVVSGYSDFGPCLQHEQPVWRDLIKWVQMQPLDELGYRGISVEGRCDAGQCNLNDKYSVKCWSFTLFTFNEIPENIVRWYCVNSLLKDERIVNIPLGIGEGSTDKLFEASEIKAGEKRRLYVNFENYNIDRLSMKYWFQAKYSEESDKEWLTLHMTCDRKQEDYFQDLRNHEFIFAPYGNGIDTYRFCETMYLGSYPIVIHSLLYKDWKSLPVCGVGHQSEITKENLEMISEQIKLHSKNFNYDCISLSYWKKRIKYDVLRCCKD